MTVHIPKEFPLSIYYSTRTESLSFFLRQLLNKAEKVWCAIAVLKIQLLNQRTAATETFMEGCGWLWSFKVVLKPFATNEGVIFDNTLSFNKQINAVLKTSFFFQLGVLGRVTLFLCLSDIEKVICAFISSQLHYGNRLCSGVTLSVLGWMKRSC